MFLFKSIKIYGRRVFLLLCLINISSFASSYQFIYNIKKPNFKYSIEDNKYKVNLADVGYILKEKEGFKLFLPNFTTDFNLEVLRVSSIGYINGFLSKKENINMRDVLNVKSYQLNYYLTDYNEKELRQLKYLLNGDVVPYNKVTSLVIEGYNLPKRLNTKLNKWIYFKFDMNEQNPLKELSYSYSMSFDKKLIDIYVKKNFNILDYKDEKFKYLHTYMMNLNSNINYIPKYSVQKNQSDEKVKKKPTSSVKKSNYYLDIKRVYTKKMVKGVGFNEKELLRALKNPLYENEVNKINYNLGVLYAKINSISSNKKAVKYFRKSEFKEAYYNLGIYYYIGLSVKENDKIAYKYFKKSKELGFEKAVKNVNIMEKYKIGTL